MREFEITHVTRYAYSMPVAFSRHAAYFRPRESSRQKVFSYSHKISPATTDEFERTDYFGNSQLQFQIESLHDHLTTEVHSRVGVAPQPAIGDPKATTTCGELRKRLRSETDRESLMAVQMSSNGAKTHSGGAVERFARKLFPDDRPFLEACLELNATIFREFKFDGDATDVSTPVDQVLQLRRGVCQDFAHLMLASIRAMRLPARYVSGYILTNPPEGKPRLHGADASHAWVSVYIPELGWVDLDPTNDLVCGDEHIVVAIGRDFDDVSPLRGAVTGGGNQEIKIAVTVMPVEEIED
jgi:transglutaminase-like putative cysteine protease